MAVHPWHVNEAAVFALMTPDEIVVGRVVRNGFRLAVFARRTDVREGPGQKFFARITIMLNGRFVDL